MRGPLALLSLLAVAALGCGGDGPGPCVGAPTYTNDVRPIVEARCLACHAAGLAGDARHGAPEGLDFDSLESTEPHLEAFADALTSGRMPPTNGPALTTAEERQLVSRWRACDFPR